MHTIHKGEALACQKALKQILSYKYWKADYFIPPEVETLVETLLISSLFNIAHDYMLLLILKRSLSPYRYINIKDIRFS